MHLHRSPFGHILSAIGDSLGENAFSLLDQVLGSIEALNAGPNNATRLHLLGNGAPAMPGIPIGGLPPNAHHRNAGRHRAFLHIPHHHDSRQPHTVRITLNPTSTILRWDQEIRATQGAVPIAERLSALTNHVSNILLPAFWEENKEPEAKVAEPEQQDSAELPAATDGIQADPDETPSNSMEEPPPTVEAAAQAMQGVSMQDPLAEVMALARTLAGEMAAVTGQQTMHSNMQDITPPEQSTPSRTDIQQASSAEGMLIDEPLPVPTDALTQREYSGNAPNTVTPTEETSPASSAPPQSRITIQIHGNTVDITDTGIDPEFLEALPEDMREEVLNQHFREIGGASATQQNQQAPDNISPEFLDALPPEIRAEVIQAERAEQNRQGRLRQRQQQRQHNNNGNDDEEGGPIDLDPASLLATIDADPELRREVLLQGMNTAGSDFMTTLPPHLLAEYEALMPFQAQRRSTRHGFFTNRRPGDGALPPAHPVVYRDAIQLLDRAGVATLVRLLFFPQQIERRLLQSILLNLCDHPKTRLEIVNFLLAILCDGTKDTSAVDRTFSQMSAKASKISTPKPNNKKFSKTEVSLSGSALLHVPGENVPNLVAQRCLEALSQLVAGNEAVARYFLFEQESLSSLVTKKAARKGPPLSAKGKEKANGTASATTMLPLSLLMNLLDRASLLSITSVMDSLTGLLATISKPLTLLAQVSKDASLNGMSSTSASALENVSVGSLPSPTAETTPAQPAAEASSATVSGEKAQFEESLQARPPELSSQNLSMVANILDANEVSGRTFSNTLALLQYFSFLPGARQVISEELTSRAKQHGAALVPSLSSLTKVLQSALTQEDVPAAILAHFTSAWSLQAKLLRVLKTVDYVASTKHGQKQAIEDPVRKQEAVDIFLSFNFETIWSYLSDCLAAVEDKDGLSHCGTVLMPLIESFLVVSKYAVKAATAGYAHQKAVSPLSPNAHSSPREKAENRFFSFTFKHRKLLNSMVKANPGLMSGSFSVLIQNPAVLEFENKRNYFAQQLHKRRDRKDHVGPLNVNVRRQYIFEDSFQSLGPSRKTPEQIKYGKLNVRCKSSSGP